MATPTVVQAKSNQTVATSTAVTITTTAGNLLVAIAYSDLSSSNTFTITDSAGQTWTNVPNTPFGVGNGRMQMWYRPNSASVTSVTVTQSGGTGTLPVVVYEINGAASSTPFDANASNAATSSNSATGTLLGSGTLSTNNANDILIYGVGENANTSGWTAGSGYTIATGGSISSGRAAMQSQGVSATQSNGTTTMSWTTAGADRLGIFAAFADTNQAALITVIGDDGEQFRGVPPSPSILVADDWLPLVPQPPLFEWDESQRWQLSRDFRVSLTTGEEDTSFLPIIPKIIYDDDSSRSFETPSKQEDEPWHTFFSIPTPPPNFGWDDWDWSRDYSTARLGGPPEAEPFDFALPLVPSTGWFDESQQMYGLTGLSALVVLDEFVNAPAGSIQFGPAPLGRSARFGFSISAFR